MRSNDLPDPIQWFEGMLLHPHHFQQESRRHEALAYYHASVVSPFHWGIQHLELDREALLGGTLRVLSMAAVMPDGLVVSHSDGRGTQTLGFQLADYEDTLRSSPMKIYLAVGGQDVAAVDQEAAGRYESVESRSIPDLNTGEGEMTLSRLRPVLHLLAEDQLRPTHVHFPLAEVQLEGESFSLTQFVPPTLRVDRSSPLGVLCATVANRLRERALYLAEQQTVSQERGTLIQGLVSGLPAFEVMVASNACHPFHLYLALATLVGHTAVIGQAAVPPMLPAYQHEDPNVSFSSAWQAVDRVLREGLSEAYEGFLFQLEGERFELEFQPAWAEQALVLGVRSRDGISESETVRWMEQSYIGSSSKFPWMRAKRVPGPERVLWHGDRDLAPRRGVCLFKVQNVPEFIVPGELLQIRNFDDPDPGRRPLEIVLHLRKSS